MMHSSPELYRKPEYQLYQGSTKILIHVILTCFDPKIEVLLSEVHLNPAVRQTGWIKQPVFQNDIPNFKFYSLF